MHSRGFTMIELLVVMGLISVLLGLGIGFLQRGDTTVDQALSILRTELRSASLTARAYGVPTQVIITPARDQLPAELRSRTLVPLASWHLEPDEIFLNPARRPQLAGVDEPAGRFGHGRRHDDETSASLFSVPAGAASFSLRDGFVLRLEVKLERAAAMVVLRLGDSVSLELDAGLMPALRMVRAVGSRGGPAALVYGSRPVPLARWCTLEVLYDGSELVLTVDDIESRQAAPGFLHQAAEDRLEISPPNGPIHGVVDEIALFGYELGEPRTLPIEVDLLGLPAVLAFGRQGRLAAGMPFQIQSGEQVVSCTLDPGGAVR